MWIAVAAANAQEALELFANEPFTFALKPIVKRVLLSIAPESTSVKQVELAVKTTFIYMQTCCWFFLLVTPLCAFCGTIWQAKISQSHMFESVTWDAA